MLPWDDKNFEKYDSNMAKVALKLLWNWREDIWSMQKESPVHKITNLDGPSVVAPDQSLEQLVSGMHQGYCQERCVVLVDAWGQELALDGRESETLMEVIQDSNKRWADELGMKMKSKISRKWRVTNWELDDGDNDGNLGEGEAMGSVGILGQPRQAGKRSIKLTMKAANAD